MIQYTDLVTVHYKTNMLDSKYKNVQWRNTPFNQNVLLNKCVFVTWNTNNKSYIIYQTVLLPMT